MKSPLTLLVLLAGVCSTSSASAQTTAVPTQAENQAGNHGTLDRLPSMDEVERVATAGPFQPEWESLEQYKIPEWYKDAKLGIFIHWGVYSVPAFGSEWYPRNMYIESEGWSGKVFRHHREKYGKDFGYKDFIPDFKAENFDASAWVSLFEEAGARYVVPVAEHHDGFPMYASSHTRWDASEMGPKRDVIAEIASAAREKGLKLGLSSHRAFNWAYFVRNKEFDNADPRYEEFYGRAIDELFESDANNYQKKYPPVKEDFKKEWLTRTAELVTKFDPDLIWFDFGIAPLKGKPYQEQPFVDYLKKFAAFYYNSAAENGKDAIINYKWTAFPEKAAILDLERSKMDAIRYPFWQTDTAVSSSSWGYTEDQKYKEPNRLVDDLVDIVSKNGCLLLNVGPRSDGTIPEQDQAILRSIGSWLKVNGAAIYESRPWKIYGEGPTGTATGHLSENKNKPFTAKDIRFTVPKGNQSGVLYATVLDWPENGEVTIESLASGGSHGVDSIREVSLLGSDAKVQWERTADGLKVTLPSERPCEFAYVLKIDR